MKNSQYGIDNKVFVLVEKRKHFKDNNLDAKSTANADDMELIDLEAESIDVSK